MLNIILRSGDDIGTIIVAGSALVHFIFGSYIINAAVIGHYRTF